MTSAAFLLTSLLVVLAPGVGVVTCVGAGVRDGRRGALAAALGCTLGVAPHLLLAVSGAAALLRADGPAFAVLRVAGVAYLLWLARSTWRADASPLTTGRAPTSVARTVREAVLANLLNPKLTAFFLAFLPQFVEPGAGAAGEMLRLGGVFAAMTLLVFLGYGLAASAARSAVSARPALVRRGRRVLAVAYVGLGLRLLAG